MRGFLDQIFQQKDCWFYWLPVGLGVGILFYFSLSAEPSIRQIGSFASLVTIGAYLTLHRHRQIFYFFIILCTFAAGAMLAQLRTYYVDAPILKEEIGFTWVRGVVENIQQRTSDDRYILDQAEIWRYPKEKTPQKVRINVRTETNGAKIGDYVAMRVWLSPPPLPVIPGSYDFARTAYFDQVGAVGYAVSPIEIKTLAEQRHTSVGNFIEAVRQKVIARIFAAFSEEDKNGKAAIAVALLTEGQGSISKKTIESMRMSGLGHLLSISGLHMVMVTASLYFMIRALLALIPAIALRFNTKKLAAVISLISGLLYLLLAGMPVPAQRAYIMVSLFFIAVIFDRTGWPMRPAVLAALIILVMTPESILSPSFQMSFAAAIALVAAYQAAPWLTANSMEKRTWLRRSWIYLVSMIFSSVVAGSATAPFSIYHFGNYAQYGVLANAFAVPLTSIVVMPAGMLALVLMPFGLEGLPFDIMGWGIKLMMEWSDYINSLPASNIKIPAISSASLGVITLGMLWLCFWKKKLRLLGIPMILAGVIIAPLQQDYPDIVIDKAGKLFALRLANGEYLFSDRKFARFSRDIWAQRFGHSGDFLSVKDLKKSDELRQIAESVEVKAECSENGCNYSKNGRHVYLSVKGEMPADACDKNDVVVVLHGQAIQCKKEGVAVISQNDLKDRGTHLLELMPGSVDIRTVKGERGSRPWT